MKSKKPVTLDPISPHIRNKVTLPNRESSPLKQESVSLPKEELKNISARGGQGKEKERDNERGKERERDRDRDRDRQRRNHIHGDIEFPVSDAPASAGKFTSPFAILKMIKEDPDLAEDFWYLNRKEDAYDFEFVTYQKRNPRQYLTISSRGVTYFTDGVTEFLSLDEWDREYNLYKRLKNIKFFNQYKKWKNFSLWKNLRRRSMIKERGEYLKSQLFILDDTLREPLLSLRTQTYRIMKADIIDLSTEDIRTLAVFNKDQNEKRDRIAKLLEEIEGTIQGVISKACADSMDQFHKENRTTIQKQESEQENNPDPFLIGDNTNKQMPYTQEAIIRTHYARLTKYIRLCDYQIIDSKISLSMQTTQKILSVFLAHEELRNAKAGRNRKQLSPLLSISCSFEGLSTNFDPNMDVIKHSLEDALIKGITVVCNNELLISVPDLEKYTQMLEDFEDKQFEEESDLMQMVINDEQIRALDIQIKQAIANAFNRVEEYSQVFLPYLEIYLRNENMDINYFRTAELDEFKKAIESYKDQMQLFGNMKETENQGIFQLNSLMLKDKLKPSPRSCLNSVQNLMPQLSMERAQELLQELNDANKKLMITPKSVDEYIEYSKFFKATSQKMDEFGQRFNGVKDLNQMIEIYGIKADDSIKQKFTECLQSLGTLRQRIQTAGERDEGDKIKFSKELREKITGIERKVRDINEKLKDDKISDREALPHNLVVFLKSIGDVVENLFTESKACTVFQDELELERTNFEFVVEMRRDFRLKYDMWLALHEWGIKIVTWHTTAFQKIEVDNIVKEVDNYYRIAMKSRALEEQGNFVPEILRNKVEELKNTMPVVVDLRSPALQPRHWEQIKEVLGKDIDTTDNSFTLRSLIEMKVNDKKDEISDIALKAKKEQELERQLTEIVKTWDSVEFQLNTTKDSDVSTLTALDEIITLLDETQVAINSIMTNRYVAPLYDKVEPYQKKFALFANTLDEWINVQKQWLYLRNIFASADIIKQLPTEQKRFAAIDTAFKKIMKGVSERNLALPAATQPGLYKEMKEHNVKLEQIQKALEDYLDKKRKEFPRFFFLSNDELLEILAQARVPSAVQPHLRKIFESIYQLDFGTDQHRGDDIYAMISAEGERVQLSRNLKARGGVEEWLKLVEADMQKSLRKEMKDGHQAYDDGNRPDWVLTRLAQVVSCVGNIMWTFMTEEALSNKEGVQDALSDWYDLNVSQLEDLTLLVRQDLTNIQRRSVVALVTQDVHNRDIVESLKENEVGNVNEFKWQQQLRYYFNVESEECLIRQVTALQIYGYEYMGATTRLVITPLTDRCWMTITGALNIKLGASPAGPAGTGKTESVKDLAKAVGQFCIVFNCSEQITFMMMEKLFLGLCNTGAWSCLDEFNRIDIEVLSVIGQQLRTIRNARWEKKTEFYLDDKLSEIKDSMGVFITMNPGYAGRTELPDNLKVCFRPMAMMVPDYTLIAEIMLFAEGFSEAKRLSGKMTKLYKLSSEQLSQQDHYDFGMRAVKSVLNMAGALKRRDPDLSEEVVLIRAMRDSNVPKFLKDDLVLFYAIVQDLFPGVEVPFVDYGELADSINECILAAKLQPENSFIEKVIQLFETFAVRFGVMIVGPATAGKTSCYQILAASMTSLRQVKNSKNQAYQEVEMKVLNPKAINMGELYGEYNEATDDWKDGLASSIMRTYSEREDQARRWVVFDGPVDALWIENMNTVLDDNMMLCLANGQRIKLKNEMRMLFEVQDLSVASPATVSRCGMVYMNLDSVGWKACMISWVDKNLTDWSEEGRKYLVYLFEKYTDKALSVVRKGLVEPIPTVDLSLVMSACAMIRSLTLQEDCPRMKDELDQFKKFIDKAFVFCFMWGLGGALDSNSTLKLEVAMSSDFAMELPRGSLFDMFVSTEKPGGEYRQWDKIKTEFVYDPSKSYFELVVPTRDTVRYAFLLRTAIKVNKPVFITGGTGVGKTVIIVDALYTMRESDNLFPLFLTFSAQTSAIQTQNTIINKLDSKRKGLVGGPSGKKVALMIDDVNMPAVERFGAQPPIELMRQYIDSGYIYDRSKHFPIEIQNTTIVCCAAPPEGGRNPLTPRFTRHFHMLCIPPSTEESLTIIFRSILDGFLKPFKQDIQSLSSMVVQATISMYNTISKELLPTPAKSHYTFNLRDVSKVFQGILMTDARFMASPDSMINLWIHETSRVFHDRLINSADKFWFTEQIAKLCIHVFRKDCTYDDIYNGKPILFGDFLKGVESEDRYYEEIVDQKKLSEMTYRLLEDYNYSGSGVRQMSLVFFQDAIEHLCRICRILRQPRGNAMLVGVGGCGKQSLTRLASFISNCKCYQITVKKTYTLTDFREDLKGLFKQTGGPDEIPTVFLMSDTQIVKESFLEDINNILNAGEVPNLFTKEELEEIENDLRPIAAQNKVYDNMYGYFVQRVRENLHVVLCMSPVGDLLRVRMRMFPSLVNCCTINWVDPWPGDALLSVSKNKLKELALDDLSREEGARVKEAISQLCVEIHMSVQDKAIEFQQALNRKVYITPKSYLDMIGLYFKLIEEKSIELGKSKSKYKRGVETIEKTNIEVLKMQEELTKLKPILEQKKQEADDLSKIVEADTIEANKVKEEAEAEEKVVSEQAAEVMKVQQDAQADLDEALPVLESALRALDQINPRDIAEIRTFSQPSMLIKFTLETVSVLLQEKTDWDSIKKTLQGGIIERLKTYPRDSIPKPVLVKLRKKIAENPDFTPEKVGNVNVASKSLCLWVIAMDKYAKVSEEVQPKRDRLEQMNKILADAMGRLKITQARLKKELDKVAALEEKRQKVLDERDRLANEARTTAVRLDRASILTESLKEEHVRWQLNVVKLTAQMRNVVGDTFLSSACISYYGPFTGIYRNQLVSHWVDKAGELKIPVSEGFDLQEVMGDPMTIRDWNIKGLPADTVSVNNGILVTRCERWPLMIDPQEQANKWIKKLEEKAGLKVCKQTDKDFARSVENSIRNGNSLLAEDVGEVLDPTLEPILQKNLVEQGAGRFALRVGDQDIDYDNNFRLYLTTKLPNPHYLPEISIKTTLINFTVTNQGLEEQLLGDVVKKEQPKIEKKKTELMIAMVKDQKSLKQAEDTILSSLSDTKGNILDNPEIIETLKNSKKLSIEISDRMLRAEENKKEVEEAFQQYLSVAVRGSILYFVIADLALIDPMYQYSLAYFARLFNTVIDNSAKSAVVEERIVILLNAITEFVFMNVCRGLFNAHKLIFSFLITSQILRRENLISDGEWGLLLKGVSLIPSTFIKTLNPEPSKITDKTWDIIVYLQNISPLFNKPLLGPEIAKNLPRWLEWASCKDPESTPAPEPYSGISSFHHLLLIKAFREEKVIYKIINFVNESLGRKYVEVPPIAMEEVYLDTNCRSPVIFILSQGADPMSMIVRLAENKGFSEKLEILSLGKGQGERAKRLIEVCGKSGKWVVLQNCHLAKSWMPELEVIVENFEEPRLNLHEDFRLMLTSMPCDYFPVPVLQNGTKITNEPPKGIRANLKRSLNAVTEEDFETCAKLLEWKRLLVSTCYFHAIIQERRKFGPLGWNIRYEFNESDLDTSILMLKNFLNAPEEALPWDAMRFMTGEINYGGRVTDDWDRRCLMSILNLFLVPTVLKDDYKFSPSGIYYIPPPTTLQTYKDYVEALPLTDQPEIFGMHDNANITFQMQESQLILSTTLSIQPRDAGKSSGGKGPDEIVDELAASIFEQLPQIMLKSEAAEGTFARDKNGLMDSLSTFLGQEIYRFNRLLGSMKKTLEDLRKAIKGIVVMSNELDKMYTSMLNNQVPENWNKVAYPSLKPLGAWVVDMKERVGFIRKWLSVGRPDAYWLSAFFFPQGFLTAVLQSFSRRYQIPIDILNFSYDFQPFNAIDQIQEVSEDGCFVYGLFMEGCRWDLEAMQLEESHPAEMYAIAPIIFFTPIENYTPDAEEYTMPVYKTSVRAGTLSTTGHSTNFIIGVECPSSKKPGHWVLKGSAFLCQLND